MPESSHFKRQKKIGRWFEAECEKLMLQKGMAVVDSEKLPYARKKGWDREVSINGNKAKIEMKYDAMSEQTGNTCIELDSLRQFISPIWLYGLKEADQVKVYAMYLEELKPFAESYPFKKRVGEFCLEAAIIPTYIFTSQPFVKKFGTISLTTVR